MRSAFVVLLLAIAALAALYFTGIIYTTPTTIEIKAGGTSIVSTYTSFAVVSSWLVGLLFSLTGLIATGFRNKLFLILFLLFIIAGAFIFYTYIYK